MHERFRSTRSAFPARFRELTGYWRELGARRVSLVSTQLLEEGIAAAQAALRASITGWKPSRTHSFRAHLDEREKSWQDARETLNRLIDVAGRWGRDRSICSPAATAR